jgi:hypothetical protein
MFDKRIIWRLHMEMIEAKAFRTFIRNYPIFISERLSANIKLMAQIISVMTYVSSRLGICPDTYFLTLQHLQRKVLSTIGSFLMYTPVRDLNTAFNFPFVYDYTIKLCMQ